MIYTVYACNQNRSYFIFLLKLSSVWDHFIEVGIACHILVLRNRTFSMPYPVVFWFWCQNSFTATKGVWYILLEKDLFHENWM